MYLCVQVKYAKFDVFTFVQAITAVTLTVCQVLWLKGMCILNARVAYHCLITCMSMTLCVCVCVRARVRARVHVRAC
jgi:hypothetical protein